MKVLLSTYSCAPNALSEPGIGWRAILHALNDGHEVWAVTEKNGHGRNILEYMKDHPMPGFHPVFLELTNPLSTQMRGRHLTGSIYYYLWQQKLMSLARKLHEEVGFDLVHHVTFGAYWMASGLRALDLPFIWGPVGAAESAPPGFLADLPLREHAMELTRDKVRLLAHLDPALRGTARAATIAIGITAESCAAMRHLGARRTEQLPHWAFAEKELEAFDRLPPLPTSGPFRAICMGRLLHWKGFHLAIRAFAIFARTHPDAELWIVNYGPGEFRGELERIIAETGMQKRILFFTNLPNHAEVMGKLAQCHVLLHPALHEGFGAVCSEAMAAGRPVVCLDVGGPATQVTTETGLVISPTTPTAAIEEMAAFLSKLADNRTFLDQLSANARARVREKFTMRSVDAAMSSYYEQAVALHAESRGRSA